MPGIRCFTGDSSSRIVPRNACRARTRPVLGRRQAPSGDQPRRSRSNRTRAGHVARHGRCARGRTIGRQSRRIERRPLVAGTRVLVRRRNHARRHAERTQRRRGFGRRDIGDERRDPLADDPRRRTSPRTGRHRVRVRHRPGRIPDRTRAVRLGNGNERPSHESTHDPGACIRRRVFGCAPIRRSRRATGLPYAGPGKLRTRRRYAGRPRRPRSECSTQTLGGVRGPVANRRLNPPQKNGINSKRTPMTASTA